MRDTRQLNPSFVIFEIHQDEKTKGSKREREGEFMAVNHLVVCFHNCSLLLLVTNEETLLVYSVEAILAELKTPRW